MSDGAKVEMTAEEYQKLAADSQELKLVRNALAFLVSQVLVPEENNEQ